MALTLVGPWSFRGLPYNSNLSIKLLPPIFVLVLTCWFQNCSSFWFLTSSSPCLKFLPPLNQKGPPLWWTFWKIVQKPILITQKKHPDALNATQKTLALYKVWILKKRGITSKNTKVKPKTPKKQYFLELFSWFFQKLTFVKSWGLLRCIQCIRTLLLSYQNQLLDNFSESSP